MGDFDFKKTYGEVGRVFIHLHHIKPLSEIKDEYTLNPIEDLIPICLNWHSMLHRKLPAYNVEEIKNFMKNINN